jgi:hypothetical protein
LDLPGRRRQAIKGTCTIDPAPIFIEKRVVVDGRFKIRMVQDIEKLRPELNVEAV